MLPSSTTTRKKRDSAKPDGRSVNQHLIGRALRSCINLKQLEGPGGGLTLFIDCDVLQADGGTRTRPSPAPGSPSPTPSTPPRQSRPPRPDAQPLTNQVAAISVGIVNGHPVLDLDYPEDVEAHVDMNVAMLADNTFVEVQGTGEHATFSTKQLGQMLALATQGIRDLHQLQLKARAMAI